MTKSAQAGQKPILIVLHQATSSPGRVGHMLRARGFPLDIRRPVLGDPLPETLEDHAGAVVFGGPMSANDPEAYVRAEVDWFAVPLRENAPVLGICLGAQMMVKHCGGTVGPEPGGRVEIGWYPLVPTPEGEALLADWPSMAYQFHREGFDLPDGFTRLATNDLYPNQAFRFGENAWGLQFHGELTLAMQHRWSVRGAHRFDLPNAQGAVAHLEGRFVHDRALRDWMERFLTRVFLKGEGDRPDRGRDG